MSVVDLNNMAQTRIEVLSCPPEKVAPVWYENLHVSNLQS